MRRFERRPGAFAAERNHVGEHIEAQAGLKIEASQQLKASPIVANRMIYITRQTKHAPDGRRSGDPRSTANSTCS